MVRIGTASIDENGKSKNGVDGDQTGKEVYTRSWYNGGWTVLLRPLDSSLAEKSAVACETICNNDNVGYNQNKRNTLHSILKKNNYDLSSITSCATDCSAFMAVCAIYGGCSELEYSSNAPTTSTMQNAFAKTGKYIALTDSKYLNSSDYLMRGDILVKAGHHTVMILDNGAKITNVSRETNDNAGVIILNVRTLKQGCKGTDVKSVQAILNNLGYNTNGVDGIFGAVTKNAVKSFQKTNALEIDGIIGTNTWSKLING